MDTAHDQPCPIDYLGRNRPRGGRADGPIPIERLLDTAREIDVDPLYCDSDLYIGGIMEHIEEAGLHSGASACTLPPVALSAAMIERIRESPLGIAEGVGVRGLLNVQYALAQGILYVLEANPRASRTVPFVAKATGVHLAQAAAPVSARPPVADTRHAGALPGDGDGA